MLLAAKDSDVVKSVQDIEPLAQYLKSANGGNHRSGCISLTTVILVRIMNENK